MRSLSALEQLAVSGGNTQTFDDGSTLTTDEDGNVTDFTLATDIAGLDQSCSQFADLMAAAVNSLFGRLVDRSQATYIINVAYNLLTGSDLRQDVVEGIRNAVNRGTCTPQDFTLDSANGG